MLYNLGSELPHQTGEQAGENDMFEHKFSII